MCQTLTNDKTARLAAVNTWSSGSGSWGIVSSILAKLSNAIMNQSPKSVGLEAQQLATNTNKKVPRPSKNNRESNGLTSM